MSQPPSPSSDQPSSSSGGSASGPPPRSGSGGNGGRSGTDGSGSGDTVGGNGGGGGRRRGKRGGRRRRRKQQSRTPGQPQPQPPSDKPSGEDNERSGDAASSSSETAPGGEPRDDTPKSKRVKRYRPDSQRYQRVRRGEAKSAEDKAPKAVRAPAAKGKEPSSPAVPPSAKPAEEEHATAAAGKSQTEREPAGARQVQPSPHAQAAVELVQPTATREMEYLWGKPGSLREPLAGMPAAIAAIAALIAGAVAMQLQLYPLIPLVAIGVLCISNWEFRWARSLWYVTLVTYILWIAAETVGVWFPFFLALIFAYITAPVVDGMARLVRSRIVATLIFFAVLLAVLVLFNWFAYGELTSTVEKIRAQVETPEAVHENVHRLVAPIGEQFDVEPEQIEEFTLVTAQTITNALSRANDMSEDSVEGLIGWASEAIGWVGAILLNLLLFLVATFYLLLDWPRLSGKVNSYFSPEQGERLSKLSREIGQILRQYVQGHSVVIFLVGLIFYLLLTIFGHPHALLLGLVMAILGLIPFLGPIIAGLIALAVTLTVPTDTGFYLIVTVVCYAAAQALNDFVLYPNIAGRSVSVNPVLALLVLFLIGFGFGVLGMFFAVPLVAISRAVIRWLNEEDLPGFEWLKLFRPYEVRHERTLKLQRDQMRALRESQRAAAVAATDAEAKDT